MPTLRAPSQRAASNVRSSSASTTTRWKLAQMSATSLRVRHMRPPPARLAPSLAHEPQHGGLQAAEAEVHAPRDVRRQQSGARSPRCVAIGVRQPGHRKAKARSLPSRASRSMTGPPGYPRPEQLRHLVVRLPRRIVARPADQLIRARLGDEIQARVPARDDEDRGRQRQFAVRERRAIRCVRRGDAPARPAVPRDQASDLANDTPTSSEPTRPGPCVTATAPMSSSDAPPSASAASTTPQMSRTCCRDASSGTTPPHSRWIAVCDATTFDATATGAPDRRSRR